MSHSVVMKLVFLEIQTKFSALLQEENMLHLYVLYHINIFKVCSMWANCRLKFKTNKQNPQLCFHRECVTESSCFLLRCHCVSGCNSGTISGCFNRDITVFPAAFQAPHKFFLRDLWLCFSGQDSVMKSGCFLQRHCCISSQNSGRKIVFFYRDITRFLLG